MTIETDTVFQLRLPNDELTTVSDTVVVHLDQASNWRSHHEVRVDTSNKPSTTTSLACHWQSAEFMTSASHGSWRVIHSDPAAVEACFERSAGLFQGLLRVLNKRLIFRENKEMSRQVGTIIYQIESRETDRQSTPLDRPDATQSDIDGVLARRHLIESHGEVLSAAGHIEMKSQKRLVLNGVLRMEFQFNKNGIELPATLTVKQRHSTFGGHLKRPTNIRKVNGQQRIHRQAEIFRRRTSQSNTP